MHLWKGVTSLASSRDTQNGPDWTDIQSVLQEMEGDLDCRIVMTTRLLARQGEKRLVVQVEAFPHLSVYGDQRQSVSLSATLDRPGCGLGVAVIYRLLLALDYEVSRVWATKHENNRA